MYPAPSSLFLWQYFQNGYFVAYASCVGMAVIGCISRWAYMKWHQQVENMRHLVFVIISSGMGMFSTLCASVSMKLLKTSIHDGEDEFKNGVSKRHLVLIQQYALWCNNSDLPSFALARLRMPSS